MNHQIVKDIELAMGHSMQTPKEFENLSERIILRTGQYISPTTLRRIWGYNREEVQPRKSTLNILANFLGYAGFDDYQSADTKKRTEIESNPVMSRSIDVSRDLRSGDNITLRWFPDRECIVEYLGRNVFEIKESKHTRLAPGTVFRCGLLIENEPLFIHIIKQPGVKRADVSYVCGKKNGITFETTEKKDVNP